MNRTNKILAGALLVQLVLAVLVFLRHDDNRIGKLEPLVDGLEAEKVDRIRVFDAWPPAREGDAGKEKKGAKPDQPAVELVKRGSDWQLASDFDYPADASKVTELLEKVTAIRTRGAIASGKTRQKQLEVADDNYQRKLVLTAGGKDVTLYVGASAGSRQTSVRLAGSDQVHAASGLSAFAVGATPAAWIDTAYFKVEKEQIASVEVTNQNGTFSLEPGAGGTWSVELNGKPVAVPAGQEIDKDMIDRVVSRISSLTMTEPGDPKRAIDKPTVTVTVRMKSEPPPTGPDGGPPAVSQPGQEYTVDFAEAGEKDRTFVKVRGSQHAALVNALSVSDLAELSASKVVRKHEDKPAPPPGGEEMPEGLPPGIDLEQLQQQMQQQGQ